MSSVRYGAPRFDHPDFALDAAGIGLSTPGRLAMVDGDASVRQSLLLLLTIRPGERPMLPEYGCQLHRLAFAPNDDTTAGLAIHYVTQAITRWEPRVDLVRVDATTHEETPGRVDVWVEYRVRTSQQADQLAVTLDLVGPNR